MGSRLMETAGPSSQLLIKKISWYRVQISKQNTVRNCTILSIFTAAVDSIKQHVDADTKQQPVSARISHRETISVRGYSLKRSNKGPITLANGATYTGEWLGDERDGFGILVWPNGSVYEGQFKNNLAHGLGKITHKDGDSYEGDWINDKADGTGVYLHVSGARYQGQWKEDKQHGYGIEKWSDGNEYQGSYVNGQKEGQGELKF